MSLYYQVFELRVKKLALVLTNFLSIILASMEVVLIVVSRFASLILNIDNLPL